MKKTGRTLVVIIAAIIQVVLGILYGFSEITVSAGGCLAIWCVCTAMICRFLGTPEMI